MGGKQPYWPEILLKCHVQPAARRLGIANNEMTKLEDLRIEAVLFIMSFEAITN
jgi:hypothetical protein